MYRKRISAVTRVPFVLSIAFGLWAVFNLCSCQYAEHAASDRTAEDGLPLHVMSFNIRYGTANDGQNRWENRRDMVFDVLRKHQADVVGLQEALRFQIDQIRQALPKYGEIGVGRDDGRTKGEYCAILYCRDRFGVDESGTFWLSDTPEVAGSITWGNACTRICTWARLVEKKSGRAFYVFNLHLDHVSQPSREKSMVLLTQRIMNRTHPDTFVVTGDFNAGEDNPAILYLKGKSSLGEAHQDKSKNPAAMVDTFRLLHPDATEVGTFNGFVGNRKGEKIDYVFATSGAEVLEAQILHDEVDGRYPSDHFPVTARLRLPTPSKCRQNGSASKSQEGADLAFGQIIASTRISVVGGCRDSNRCFQTIPIDFFSSNRVR